MKFHTNFQISVCFPTLNRYDLLDESIKSLQQGKLKPTDIWVIDNGGAYMRERLLQFVDEFNIRHHYVKFGYNLGCAASWNWFGRNVPDIRIISNDDIKFQEDTVEKFVAAYDRRSVLCPENIIGSNSFSCFTLPTFLYESVGEFDEDISPNYCYHEDVDYSRRLRLAGFNLRDISNCNVDHFGSSTVKSYSPKELNDHHRKFKISEENYIRKWNGRPNEETLITPNEL